MNEAKRHRKSKGIESNKLAAWLSTQAVPFTCESRLKANPIPIPGNVIASGRSFRSASVKMSPTIRKLKTQYLTASGDNPKVRKLATKSKAVSDSTIMYRGEIGSLQLRHLPRSTNQPTTGTL